MVLKMNSKKWVVNLNNMEAISVFKNANCVTIVFGFCSKLVKKYIGPIYLLFKVCFILP